MEQPLLDAIYRVFEQKQLESWVRSISEDDLFHCTTRHGIPVTVRVKALSDPGSQHGIVRLYTEIYISPADFHADYLLLILLTNANIHAWWARIRTPTITIEEVVP